MRLEELRKMVNLITMQDVGLEGSRALMGEEQEKKKKAPVTYIDVYEHSDVSVGIFIIHPGCKIPLHNHPNMYGIIKCLSGKVRQ